MIDLGLTKLALIGVVALVVIGPEKLPKVARMAGTLYGRAQRYLTEIKTEVSREIELDELRALQKEVQESAQAIKSGVENSIAQHLDDADAAWRDYHPVTPPRATMSDLERKARLFHKKKQARNSAIPGWYKRQHGGKSHVVSGAARVARHRPRSSSSASFY